MLKFSSRFWKKRAETLTFERLDAKSADQSRPVWTEVGTAEGIVEVDERLGYLQSEKGLDKQDFRYSVIIRTGDVSALIRNKDRITTEDGTHLHIINNDPVKASVYHKCTCSNVEDPNMQGRR